MIRAVQKALLFVLAWGAFSAGYRGFAQEADFFHPELEWSTIETPHFYVHYHNGAERTARVVAKVAEDVYEPVTSLYNHKPDGKVHFVIRDIDDISNGGAYFFENKIEILAPNLDFEFRGTHNWLRNVVTHEFTHVVQIQTSMKFGRRVPSIYFQWLGYESERRPDVLYGYPNVIVSYPISGFMDPVWFAEGVAQYNRKELRYDSWDSHRDMILRSYALDHKMLSWEEMGVFGKTSLGNESAYNAGFAFVHYLSRTYGEDKLQEISRNLATFSRLSIDGAIEKAVGKSGARVYEDWRHAMETEYAARVAPIREDLREGTPFINEEESGVVNPGQKQNPETILAPRALPPGAHQEPCCRSVYGTGFANLYPAYSPDGRKVAYVSTKEGDYFSLSSLYVYDFETGKEELIKAGVRTAPCWSPDGTMLYYTRATREHPHWALQFDVYRCSVDSKDEERVTVDKRASNPAVSPDGSTVAFIVSHDGTTNIAVMKTDGTGYNVITPYANGEQVYNLKWSPKGDRILFDYSERDGRDLAWVKTDGSGLQFLVKGDDDARDGTFTPDATRIFFASDRTGIFNVYSYDIATGAVAQITNVLGGAFYPTVNRNGDIVYSSYTSSGYKVVRMQHPGAMAEGNHHYVMTSDESAGPSSVLASTSVVPTTPQFDWNGLRSYDDTQLPALNAKPYRSMFTSLTVVPFLRIDNYNTSSSGLDMFKPGVYLFSNDFLDKAGFFAGAALNRKLERDLFLQFFYRGRIPLLYSLGLEPSASLEVYDVSRKTQTAVTLVDRPTFDLDVTYDLFEFDAALKQPLLSQFNTVELRYAHSRYTSALGSWVNTAVTPNQLVPATSDLYLVANTITLTYDLNAIVPSSTDDINPVGRKVRLKVSREFNKFGASDSAGYRKYKVTDTGLRPEYDYVNFTRLEGDWKEHFPFFFRNHTLTLSLHGGTIIGGPVDEFFDFYGGGLLGMKGYPFYALGGNSLASVGVAYRFPLIQSIDVRIGQVYLDKLYASVYGDLGNAWTSSKPALGDFKKDAGMQLRLDAFSFYALPTKVFFDAAYGFDRFSKFLPLRNTTVTYGKEWRFYFGVLFGFDLE